MLFSDELVEKTFELGIGEKWFEEKSHDFSLHWWNIVITIKF